MKAFKKDFILWGIICLFLLILFSLYNRLETTQDNGKGINTASDLHPFVAKQTDLLVQLAAEQKINVLITETVRSEEEQNDLYAQGRTAGGKIVTYAKAGESFHNYGLAVDFALINSKDNVIWDIHYDGNGNGKSDWFEVAEIAKSLGFEWGGDWNNFKDYPHLQMTFGLSLIDLQRGLRPEHEEFHK